MEQEESTIASLRSYRIHLPGVPDSIALFDLAGTVIISILVGRQFGVGPLASSIGGIALGVLVHKMLSISTPITRAIDGERPKTLNESMAECPFKSS